jgi:hypothetical protein
VADTARLLKRMLVQEQGDLLDGLRRDGAAVVTALVTDTDRQIGRYTGVVDDALRALAADVGATGEEVLEAARAEIERIALAPARAKLAAAADRTDDPDELADAVRAVYRESRSRRLPDAAEACVAVVVASVTVGSGG